MLDAIDEKFDSKQHGTLKWRTTTHILVNVLHLCYKVVDGEQFVRIVEIYIDYAKAFYHVNPKTVLITSAKLAAA